MDLLCKSIKCNKRSPAFSSFKEKECRAFYCIYFYFELPHNTSKKLLRTKQIQLVIVHARRILVPHAALIPQSRPARTCAAPHRSRYANQRSDTPCPRSPPPVLPPRPSAPSRRPGRAHAPAPQNLATLDFHRFRRKNHFFLHVISSITAKAPFSFWFT